MSHPFSLIPTRDHVTVYTNEMPLLLDVVESVAATVPMHVLEQVGQASNRMSAVLSWDEPDKAVTLAALELDHARNQIPGFGLELGKLTRDECIALAHDLLRVAHNAPMAVAL